MPTIAVKVLRRMRGRTQAHLLQAADGCHYVVKFLSDLQHRRVLVNEWIGTALLKALGISCPASELVYVPSRLLGAHPGLAIDIGDQLMPVMPGWHYGSRFPGDPAKDVVYDFVPDRLLPRVNNARDFVGTFVFDRWAANMDVRQAIFVRASSGGALTQCDGLLHRTQLLALMVDHGQIFNGPQWRLLDSMSGDEVGYANIYRWIRNASDVQPWLQRVEHISESVIQTAIHQLPPEWVDEDRADLLRLMAELMARRQRVHEVVLRCLHKHLRSL